LYGTYIGKTGNQWFTKTVIKSTHCFLTEIGGKSGRVGASLGRVFVMASLRFGQSKEPSQLIAPVKAEGKNRHS
jgi:hypothetical protein